MALGAAPSDIPRRVVVRGSARVSKSIVVIVDGSLLGQHALMQDSRNHNASSILTVKHHVAAALHPSQTLANMIACSA
jgi:hypothetical protein